MNVNNKYQISENVFIKTDTDQTQRIIVAILVDINGFRYEVKYSNIESWHYEFELSTDKDYSKI